MLNPNEPPEFGELEFEVGISPASIQAKKITKDQLASAIWKITEPLNYIFLGDLQIEIEWFAAPKLRFESDKSPDIDNIVKPIIDALCGSKGLLIDDCQLQSCLSYWMYNYDGNEKFIIRLKYVESEWTFKKDLAFIQFDNALCLPLELGLPKEAIKLMMEAYRKGFEARKQLTMLNIHDSYTRGILPTYRVFHRTRIKDFQVIKADELGI